MRILLIVVVVVVLMALVGWIKFGDSPERAIITIEKETIQQDAERVVERGNEFVENTRQAVGTDKAEPVGAPQNGSALEPLSPTTDAAPPSEAAEPIALPPTAPLR